MGQLRAMWPTSPHYRPVGQQQIPESCLAKETNLVALSTGLAAGLAATTSTAAGGAVAGDVAGLAAAVAGLGVLGALGAVTAWRLMSGGCRDAGGGCGDAERTHVALATAVVAGKKHLSVLCRCKMRRCRQGRSIPLGGTLVGAVAGLSSKMSAMWTLPARYLPMSSSRPSLSLSPRWHT